MKPMTVAAKNADSLTRAVLSTNRIHRIPFPPRPAADQPRNWLLYSTSRVAAQVNGGFGHGNGKVEVGASALGARQRTEWPSAG